MRIIEEYVKSMCTRNLFSFWQILTWKYQKNTEYCKNLSKIFRNTQIYNTEIFIFLSYYIIILASPALLVLWFAHWNLWRKAKIPIDIQKRYAHYYYYLSDWPQFNISKWIICYWICSFDSQTNWHRCTLNARLHLHHSWFHSCTNGCGHQLIPQPCKSSIRVPMCVPLALAFAFAFAFAISHQLADI